MKTVQGTAPFPGRVGVSRVSVYDWEARDGFCGGSPHLHTASTEAYYVLSGSGRVETIRGSGFTSYDLVPNDLLWFSPGTIHRLINEDNLELLVVMQNAGLPEAGDAVLTFPSEVVADPQRYEAAAALHGAESIVDAARARRDAAMAGYQELKDAAMAGRTDLLESFHRSAVKLIQPRVPAWKALWAETIAPEPERTLEWLDELGEGRFGHFADAAVARSRANEPGTVFGMCGTLQKWDAGHVV